MNTIEDRELVCDVFRAYYDARTNKRNTVNQLAFEINLEENLFSLAREIHDRTYKVGYSVCFIVENPVKREIFAADFRDRVVHHLIYNYVNDIFDSKLIRDCYSCRKGFGTSDGVNRIVHHMRSVTENYTRQAYVLKLDIQGYFMSINRAFLFSMVEKILTDRRYAHRPRIELSLWLLREVIFNDPTENCQKRGDITKWEGLPRSKSLFSSPEGCGLPIGNLTSQMFSNLYLSDFDNWVKRDLKMKHYGRYVDDFYFMHPDRDHLVKVKDIVTEHLWTQYGLVVHPNKIYLQNVSHGVTFLGTHVKPYRNYIRSRTLGSLRDRNRRADYALLHNDNPDFDTLSYYTSLVNSQLGYLSQFKSFEIRKDMWKKSKGLKKHFSIDKRFKKVKPEKSKYDIYCPDPNTTSFEELFPE